MVLVYLSLFCEQPFDQNISSFFMYFFFCAQTFDQKLWSSLIYFVYLHMIMWSKYIVLFNLFFLLWRTIRSKIRILIVFVSFICPRTIRFDQSIWSFFIYSFFCARPFGQKWGIQLIYFFYLYTTIQRKLEVILTV